MSDLRKAAQAALEALEAMQSYAASERKGLRICDEAILALRAALEQAEPVEPVVHRVVAGALFDFMGWLTSRRERLVLSSTDDAAPAADAIKDFAEMRGLSLDDAKVQDWNTAPPQRKPLTDDRLWELWNIDSNKAYENCPTYFQEFRYTARLVEWAHGIGEEV